MSKTLAEIYAENPVLALTGPEKLYIVDADDADGATTVDAIRASFTNNTIVISDDPTIDRYALIQALIDAIDAIAEVTPDGNGYSITLSGAFLLSQGLVVPGTLRGLTIQGGQLIADPDSGNWVNSTPILELDGIRCKVIGTNFECSHVCSGIGDYGGRNTIRDCRILHYAVFGVDLSGGVGDTKLISCAINQWLNGEAESDADFTADGIKLTTQDVKIVGNTVSGNGVNFYATGTAGSSLIRGNHFFNGTQFDDLTIVSITNANPGVVTVTGHGLANGKAVSFDVNGMTELDGNVYRTAGVTANTFTLIDRDGVAINTTAYGVFTDGTVAPLRTNPKNIRCLYGAGGMQFLGNYFGNGEIDLYTDNVTIADTFGLNIDNNAYLSYLICLFGQPGVNHPSAFRMRNWRWSSAILNQGTVPQLITAPNDDLDEYTDDLTIFAPDGYDAWQFLAVGDRMTIGRPYEDLAPVLTIISPNDTGDGTLLGFANKGTTDLDDLPRLGAYGDRMQVVGPAASATVMRVQSPTTKARLDFQASATAANPYLEAEGDNFNLRADITRPVTDITQDLGSATLRFDEIHARKPIFHIPAASYLVTNSTMGFRANSDSLMTLQYQGSDGTIRGIEFPLGATAPNALLEALPFDLGDETSAITASAVTPKRTIRMPYPFTLVAVRFSLTTAQATNGGGGILTFDIKESGASIFSTLPTIDNTEKTSVTAATPAVISDAVLGNDNEITFFVPQIGDGTATGPKVYLIGYRTP